MREPLTLDSRLSAIERMIPPCRSVADIGADHGMLRLFCCSPAGASGYSCWT